MESYEVILTKYVSEQIALEEHLCGLVAEQISEIGDGADLDGVRLLLEEMSDILERHFQPLNDILSQLEKSETAKLSLSDDSKVRILRKVQDKHEENPRISKMLRDDYSALSLITMSNTLLHTAALLVDKQDVAQLALQHLKNLTPLVMRIGEMMPEVMASELYHRSPKIDRSLAKQAIENVKLAWRSTE